MLNFTILVCVCVCVWGGGGGGSYYFGGYWPFADIFGDHFQNWLCFGGLSKFSVFLWVL